MDRTHRFLALLNLQFSILNLQCFCCGSVSHARKKESGVKPTALQILGVLRPDAAFFQRAAGHIAAGEALQSAN
jgi:hypothetical protein